MLERIEISVIPHDTRHEDTIFQIANTLDCLQNAANHIFQCIDNRLSGYGERLSDVRSKADKLQNQLTYLQTNLSLKATKMYSDAKYPAYSTYREYETIIKPLPKAVPTEKEEESLSGTSKPHNQATKDDHWSPETILKEKLQFYYVTGKPLKKVPWPERRDGLISNDVLSLSSLLLIDDETAGRPSLLPPIASSAKGIEDAPDSIVQPWYAVDFESPSYLYAPVLGDVPQIDVPIILPDLPGIVDDERFTLDLKFQSPIAPSSAVSTPIRIDLPEAQEARATLPPVIGDSTKLSDAINDSRPNVELPLPASLPPPPPIVDLPIPTNFQIGKTETDVPSIPIANLPPAPPPPPPPPPLPPPDEAPEKSPQIQKVIAKKIQPVDDRTNLMAAIRAAGGVGRAKLRNAHTIDENTDRWASASVGGDLMADLHAKLALRRKAFAGGSMPSAMERMSHKIPPPAKFNEASTSDRNSATSENDSQPDTEDWE